MGRNDTAAVRCAAPYPVRREFYAALARAVAGARRPAGVVLETVVPERTPWGVVRPATVRDDLAADVGARCGPLEFDRTPASPTPPAGACDRVGVVRPGGAGPATAPDPVPPAPPAPASLLGPGGWLALQTLWIGGPHGTLWAARRFRYAGPDRRALAERFDRVAAAVAVDWSTATGGPAIGVALAGGGRRAWRRRSLGGIPSAAWTPVRAGGAADLAESRWLGPAPGADPPSGHTVVFGASGAGKTTFLAARAAAAIDRGERVVAIDLHGDLAPAVYARLSGPAAGRVVAVDAERRPVPGIAALGGSGVDDRSAALLVATVKRLSADGAEVYWGFRLERVFDSFVRLVQESGGSLLDLYDLLTDEDRRDAARLATRRPELARFLAELAPVVRRNPDYLWPAATRLSKVALVPALAELLAPGDGGLPVEDLLAAGRSLLVRLPFGQIGPEAASLAGTFVLARVFLGLAGRAPAERGDPAPVRLVLDEVHALSPRLVAEVLAESRKFGLRVVVATQYPDRLAPEVRSAAAGAATRFVAFRVPPPTARDAGAWLGLDRLPAERLLPALPVGEGIELDTEGPGLATLPPVPAAVAARPWSEAVGRTQEEYAPRPAVRPDAGDRDPVRERLLLAVLAADEGGAPLAEEDVVRAAAALPGPRVDPALLADRWRAMPSLGWIDRSGGRCRLGPAGERWLGLTAPTLASRESAEHRRLLLRAFRIFARHGVRLEILRQGRFDTTLPDARFRQLPTSPSAPVELAGAIDRARREWAWRCFGGRDVHVEAEVSGALRPERIRHGWAKADAAGAFVLFVVGDAERARRVRTALARAGVPRDRAQVWTLPTTPPANP